MGHALPSAGERPPACAPRLPACVPPRQAFLDGCGIERGKAYSESKNKAGAVPLHYLVTSAAFTDNHLRTMLRVSDQSAHTADRYGRSPLDYLDFNEAVTPFQAQVADEAREAHEREAERGPSGEGTRLVDDSLALRLLEGVQKYSIWFNGFSYADLKGLLRGADAHRLLVSRFQKGGTIVRKGDRSTFVAILLQGELGIRLGKGAGFPRRLHKGALFGERAMFEPNGGASPRDADVVALTDGFITTILYSDVKLMATAQPELLERLSTRLAEAALEEQLADVGMSLDDLEAGSRKRQVAALLENQESARWDEKHQQLLRSEAFYADLVAEIAHRARRAEARRQAADTAGAAGHGLRLGAAGGAPPAGPGASGGDASRGC